MSDIITIRIPKKLKQKLKEFNIDVANLVRNTLSEEVKRRETEIILKSIENLDNVIKKLDCDEIVQMIREDREGR
ncbi:MAG: hypothetical protein ACTSRP_25430 [Candidatus Helarchaeota archaeon]